MAYFVSFLYLLVVVSGFYGASLNYAPVYLRWLYLAIAMIFLFCGCHYFLFALNLQGIWINIELWLVVAGAVSMVAAFNPYTIHKYTQRAAQLELADKIYEARKLNSPNPFAVLRFFDYQRSEVVEVNQSMLDWFSKYDVADPKLVIPGSNWFEHIPHVQEWKDYHHTTAVLGKRYREEMTNWPDKKIWFQWGMAPLDIEQNLYLVEWIDATDAQNKIKSLDADLKRCKNENADIARKILASIQERGNECG